MANMTDRKGNLSRVAVVQKVNGSTDVVASLLEDVEKVPSWHPVLHTLTRGKNNGRGVGSTQEFKAKVRGREVTGTFEATAWESRKRYSWKGSETVLEAPFEVQYVLTPWGKDATEVNASISYEIPDELSALIAKEGTDQLAQNTLEEVLRQLDLAARSHRPPVTDT